MFQAVTTEHELDVPRSELAPKTVDLEFVSLTAVSSPSHNIATIKLIVDGEERVFEHNGGVGPVDAICGALRDFVPDFQVLHCRTEESGPGSDAHAKAIVQMSWAGIVFEGVGINPNTLDATAIAIVDALQELRLCKAFTGGRDAIRAEELWAGFLIDESGGTRGKGAREIALFRVTFETGTPLIEYAKSPASKDKRRFAKEYHSEQKFAIVKTRTSSGDTCHLFVTKSIHHEAREDKKSCQLS